jgi:Fe-S cluster biogenesis protein NfuA/nitrite reductase/ring-hydroxylating ferredoxin subunit
VSIATSREFERLARRTEALVHDLEALPEGEARERASAAIDALLALHGEGLARLLDLLAERGHRALIDELAGDEVVSALLLLHGLHPLGTEARVRRALEKVKPYLGSHGGDVELLGMEEGVVRLRLRGSCDGCPSSTQTLKYAIEEAIVEAAPEVSRIAVDGLTAAGAAPAGFVPVGQLRSEWHEVRGLELPPGTVREVEVAGLPLLFCGTSAGRYAYRPTCGACGASLAGATLEGPALTCPRCGVRFDVERAGRSADGGRHLEPVPLLGQGEALRIALPGREPT